jgi:hypothetical protein
MSKVYHEPVSFAIIGYCLENSSLKFMYKFLVTVHGPSIVELLGYSCDFFVRKGTDTTRSGTRSLASVPFLLRFFEVVKVCGRYLPVNGYSSCIIRVYRCHCHETLAPSPPGLSASGGVKEIFILRGEPKAHEQLSPIVPPDKKACQLSGQTATRFSIHHGMAG